MTLTNAQMKRMLELYRPPCSIPDQADFVEHGVAPPPTAAPPKRTLSEKEIYELGRVVIGYLSWIDPDPDELTDPDRSKESVEELQIARNFFKMARAYYLKADMCEPEREVALETIESLACYYRYPPVLIDEAVALKKRVSSMQAPAEILDLSRVMGIMNFHISLGMVSAEDVRRLRLA